MRKGLFYISGILIFTSLLSSCVSKKKYEELARAKRSIDREVATLENDKKSSESEMQKLKDEHPITCFTKQGIGLKIRIKRRVRTGEIQSTKQRRATS